MWRMSFPSAVASRYLSRPFSIHLVILSRASPSQVLGLGVSHAPRDTHTFQLFTTKLSGRRNRLEIVAHVGLFRTVGKQQECRLTGLRACLRTDNSGVVLCSPVRNLDPGSLTMSSTNMRQIALITRDAHLALLDLKRLVDSTAERIRAAELQSVGAALGSPPTDDPLRALRIAADTLRSSDFEAAVSQARAKTEYAVSCCVTATTE